jgi:hypothetical protein
VKQKTVTQESRPALLVMEWHTKMNEDGEAKEAKSEKKEKEEKKRDENTDEGNRSRIKKVRQGPSVVMDSP